ncbi:esterase E4-like [Belonocnema kinseyi]|uniref:esterase E4-like n=1 Tax=Belonocnema kinseyi TaxID=2817044 RepID=UPI00143D2EBC|nr:esterase E4-like [Belonocnema kinseyi]XP_033207583.1 esterase E4-like [Belonocnema kinseyi]XP_033207584.1 esterase E4-like [Belonocnema kinseyi]XP_033207585.1 esterase E4-like [Belonocnema kinseyi]
MGQFFLTGLCIFVAFLNFDYVFTQTETLEISALGKLKGSFMETRLGKRIYAFRGVRFGEPPVGTLRFEPPVPVKPWNGIFDASVEGPACPQPLFQLTSEDCLRLNIYTTKLPNKDHLVKRPVIVFFHPGGFYSLSGQSDQFGPEYLLDKDVLLVTVNYRIGSLGFLSAGDPKLLGNMGLKDQVIALRWIKKNIETFGGNPDCVTITGYSAGAWSVSLHLVSPMSRGLFHRAIAMSGSVTYQQKLGTNQKNLAIKQADVLNCPSDTVENIVSCLRTKSATDIANTFNAFDEWYGDPVLRWTPIVEPEVPGVERFLTAEPIDLIRQGKVAHVPFIGGVNKDEFGATAILPVEEAAKGNFTFFEQWNSDWDHIAPISFQFERNTSRTNYISHELKKAYLNGTATLENIDGISNLYSDALISFSGHRLVNLLAASTNMPVFYYHFMFQGRYSHATWSDGRPFGVVHHDDLMYVFYISRFPKFVTGDPEIPTVEKMTAIWENFARTGEPIPKDNLLFKNVEWKKFTTRHNRYLELDVEFTLKSGLINSERMAVWDRLFPLSSGNY